MLQRTSAKLISFIPLCSLSRSFPIWQKTAQRYESITAVYSTCNLQWPMWLQSCVYCQNSFYWTDSPLTYPTLSFSAQTCLFSFVEPGVKCFAMLFDCWLGLAIKRSPGLENEGCAKEELRSFMCSSRDESQFAPWEKYGYGESAERCCSTPFYSFWHI